MDAENTLLVEGCSRNDPEAQMKLYELYSRRLYGTCLRIIGNTSEAEEAMQDAFLKVFRRIDQYDRKKNFEVWMHRIAVNTSIDYVRRQLPFQEELEDHMMIEEDTAMEDEAEIAFSVAKIKDGIQKLATGYRLILTLYLFEGYDMEEIALILQVKPATIRTQYMRGKNRLIELMKG